MKVGIKEIKVKEEKTIEELMESDRKGNRQQ